MEPSTTDDEMLVTENVQVCLDGGTRAEVMGFYPYLSARQIMCKVSQRKRGWLCAIRI